jgi:TolB-like protein/Flp pilus assembly protein TadD
LPFTNLSGDPSEEYFSDGTTEDVISALARFSDLAVTPYVAVQAYKGRALQPDEVRRELGVCYVLTGSIRKSGEQALVTAQLIDALSGRLLWSNKYEGDLKGLSATRNEITLSVVGQLAIKIEDLERRRALKKPTDNLDAYDLVLRGRAAYERNTRSTNNEARELFEQAIRLDPNYASAYAALGNTYVTAAAAGWTEFLDDAYSTAERSAQKAIGLDKDNAEAHRLLSDVYFYRGQFELAMNEIDLAVDLNQSDAAGYSYRGGLLASIGRSKEAISDFEIAKRLNPGLVSNPMGWAYYLQRRYKEAATFFEEGARLYPNDFTNHAGRAATYAQLGRSNDAAQSAADVMRTWPFFRVKQFSETYEDEADRALVAEGLLKAGLR